MQMKLFSSVCDKYSIYSVERDNCRKLIFSVGRDSQTLGLLQAPNFGLSRTSLVLEFILSKWDKTELADRLANHYLERVFDSEFIFFSCEISDIKIQFVDDSEFIFLKFGITGSETQEVCLIASWSDNGDCRKLLKAIEGKLSNIVVSLIAPKLLKHLELC